MNRILAVMILGMIFLAGCGGKKGPQTNETGETPAEVEVETQINTSSVSESETGVEVDEIEEQINESEDILSDW